EGAPEIEITAAIDSDPTRARAIADETGARVFTSLSDGLAEGDFEAVDLMLPHHLHEEVAVAAFAAGKHVLLEKPMATTLPACDRLPGAAGRAGAVFMVAETAQYWREIAAAKRPPAAGAIGALWPARASFQTPPIPEYYGGERAWRLDETIAGGGIA